MCHGLTTPRHDNALPVAAAQSKPDTGTNFLPEPRPLSAAKPISAWKHVIGTVCLTMQHFGRKGEFMMRFAITCLCRSGFSSGFSLNLPLLLAIMVATALTPAALAAAEAAAEVEASPAPQKAREVSQFGITWTFDKEYRVGKFVTGDWWVVGPVNIIKIDPVSQERPDGRIINGSMINPVISGDTGFDTHPTPGRYKSELNVAFGISAEKPLVLKGGTSLLSAMSRAEPARERGLEVVAILTVLDEPPPADAFRPAYMAGDKTIYRYSQVDTDRLTNLKVVGSPPSWDEINKLVEMPFLDIAPMWNRYHMNPVQNGSGYGRDTSKDVSRVTVMLLADYRLEQKKAALVGLVQRGIDLYGIFSDWNNNRAERSFPWTSDGGHSSGRKWPIVFAGAMLGNKEMQIVGKTAENMFHEDNQTVYITQAHIDQTNSPQWKPPYDGKRGKQPYSQQMLGMPEWVGNSAANRANAYWTGHPYRLGGNQHAFHGMTLGVLVMGLKEQWNHDAWFDYQTRYVAILDGKPDPFAKLLGYEPVEGSVPEKEFDGWIRHWDRWSYDMWHEHWFNYYKLPQSRPGADAAKEAVE